MTKTIVLTTVVVDKWTVDMNSENVTVRYRVTDVEGTQWAHGMAVFWRNIPILTDGQGNPLPTPDEWFQLPTSYVATLATLNGDIITALANRFAN